MQKKPNVYFRGECVGEIFPIGGESGQPIEINGYLNEGTWAARNESIRRVYGTTGSAPTVPTGTGGGVMPKIAVSDEKDGELEFIGGIGQPKRLDDGKELSRNFNQGNRVYDDEGIANSLPASPVGGQGGHTGLYAVKKNLGQIEQTKDEALNLDKNYGKGLDNHGQRTGVLCAMRGRNPDNPSDRTTGAPTEQRLEENEDGTTNTLTSVAKDNLWLEGARIRRLTTVECERLQDFFDGFTEFGVPEFEIDDRKCAKQTTIAVIENNGEYWVGSNWCDNPQPECPRREMETGEGYELCREICKQYSHAEVDACLKAGKKAEGGTLYLLGHTYCCENCKKVMEEHGIKEVVIGELPVLPEVGISDTQRYKCMGNSVTTSVISAIGSKLLEHIKECECVKANGAKKGK